MGDRSFLAWPFFEERHRALAGEVEAWAQGLSRHPRESGDPAGGGMDSRIRGNDEGGRGNDETRAHDVDGRTRRLVARLGAAGWLRHCVPPPYGEGLDVRTLCLVRETLARHEGLADFAFAMQ